MLLKSLPFGIRFTYLFFLLSALGTQPMASKWGCRVPESWRFRFLTTQRKLFVLDLRDSEYNQTDWRSMLIPGVIQTILRGNNAWFKAESIINLDLTNTESCFGVATAQLNASILVLWTLLFTKSSRRLDMRHAIKYAQGCTLSLVSCSLWPQHY